MWSPLLTAEVVAGLIQPEVTFCYSFDCEHCCKASIVFLSV